MHSNVAVKNPEQFTAQVITSV